MRIKLDSTVRRPDGSIAKLKYLIETGEMELREVKMSAKNDRGWRIAYFADFRGTTSGFEIGKYAYDSYLSKVKSQQPI